jgi:hypothetical protein
LNEEMTGLETWITRTCETGILDWPTLRAAVAADLQATLTQQTHFDDHYYHRVVVYSSENSIIPNTIFPQVAQSGSFQRFAYAPGIFQERQSIVQELLDPFSYRPIEAPEILNRIRIN